MKRTYPKLLGDIIKDALRESNLEVEAAEHRAAFLWAEVMGPVITRYTSRRFVENGVLHVFITSAPLKNELSFHREKIITAINKAVGSDVLHSIVIH